MAPCDGAELSPPDCAAVANLGSSFFSCASLMCESQCGVSPPKDRCISAERAATHAADHQRSDVSPSATPRSKCAESLCGSADACAATRSAMPQSSSGVISFGQRSASDADAGVLSSGTAISACSDNYKQATATSTGCLTAVQSPIAHALGNNQSACGPAGSPGTMQVSGSSADDVLETDQSSTPPVQSDGTDGAAASPAVDRRLPAALSVCASLRLPFRNTRSATNILARIDMPHLSSSSFCVPETPDPADGVCSGPCAPEAVDPLRSPTEPRISTQQADLSTAHSLGALPRPKVNIRDSHERPADCIRDCSQDRPGLSADQAAAESAGDAATRCSSTGGHSGGQAAPRGEQPGTQSQGASCAATQLAAQTLVWAPWRDGLCAPAVLESMASRTRDQWRVRFVHWGDPARVSPPVAGRELRVCGPSSLAQGDRVLVVAHRRRGEYVPATFLRWTPEAMAHVVPEEGDAGHDTPGDAGLAVDLARIVVARETLRRERGPIKRDRGARRVLRGYAFVLSLGERTSDSRRSGSARRVLLGQLATRLRALGGRLLPRATSAQAFLERARAPGGRALVVLTDGRTCRTAKAHVAARLGVPVVHVSWLATCEQARAAVPWGAHRVRVSPGWAGCGSDGGEHTGLPFDSVEGRAVLLRCPRRMADDWRAVMAAWGASVDVRRAAGRRYDVVVVHGVGASALRAAASAGVPVVPLERLLHALLLSLRD